MIDFELPPALIAQTPAHPRDHARLLVYQRSTGTISDVVFAKLPQFLPAHSTLVLNNSRVEQCRWLFADGTLEIFVLQKLDTHTVCGMVRPGRKFRAGQTVQLTDDISAEVISIDEDGLRTLRLSLRHDDDRLKAFEHIPLPPYIAQNDRLADEYQTVYAKPLGSKAAPTAGLHFTPELLLRIGKDHPIAELTLHVGLGTFAPLTDQQLATGHLHEEFYYLDTHTAAQLNSATHRTAVGTTTVRTLESAIQDGQFAATPAPTATSILIQPGHSFKAVDSLMTNFHLPGTSLLLLVEAFVGSAHELERIYQHAIVKQYRFYSFGDAMLVL